MTLRRDILVEQSTILMRIAEIEVAAVRPLMDVLLGELKRLVRDHRQEIESCHIGDGPDRALVLFHDLPFVGIAGNPVPHQLILVLRLVVVVPDLAQETEVAHQLVFGDGVAAVHRALCHLLEVSKKRNRLVIHTKDGYPMSKNPITVCQIIRQRFNNRRMYQ